MLNKTKREDYKMNKHLVLGIVSLFAIAVVTAGFITSWFTQVGTFQVISPISVDGNTEFSQTVMAGDTVLGDAFTISNSGSEEIDIKVTHTEEEGITVSYLGSLELTKKTVDFSSDVWEIPEEADKVDVVYTIIGDSFTAEVEESLEGYTLIYYKDDLDRFANPGEVIYIEDVVQRLPYTTDSNFQDYDYCDTGEYLTCHGAKLWYIPTDAINEGSIDWSRAGEFYFESLLIEFQEDELTMYPGMVLTLTPQYHFDTLLEPGEYIITTYITPKV